MTRDGAWSFTLSNYLIDESKLLQEPIKNHFKLGRKLTYDRVWNGAMENGPGLSRLSELPMNLQEILREKKFENAPVSWEGVVERFDRSGPNTGWFVGRKYSIQEKEVLVARFGDWKSDEAHTWKSTLDLSKEELVDINEKLVEMTAREAKEREDAWEKVALDAATTWEEAAYDPLTPPIPPYLVAKGVYTNGTLYGCRAWSHEKHGLHLLVPAKDVNGKLWGLQRIGASGFKSFYEGMKIRGFFHTIGEIDPQGEVYVCEGIATAVSVFLATGKPTVSAFNAGNLRPVCDALRGRYPHVALTVCGDEDLWTTRPTGEKWNPGRESAARAASQVRARLVLPRFKSLDGCPTDFNDLHFREGLTTVREQLKERGDEVRRELVPAKWGVNKAGKPQAPSHLDVCRQVLNFYDGHLIKQVNDLFQYLGTHWKLLTPPEVDEIYKQLELAHGGQPKFSELKAMFDLLMVHMPSSPVEMFSPRPFMANFQNGTLHVVRDPQYKYQLEFKPHNPRDFLLTLIPLKYDPSRSAKNTEFELMMGRVFEGDPDQVEKLRAVKQMYGACLCPIFPRLFLLHGPQGSGKTSLILPAMRLVAQENWCSVEPHEFSGFLMESMAGKLVNFVTDISLTRSMDDANVKKIEDRVPMRIDRKFKTPLYVPLPAIHVFGANGLPKSLDGVSGAHTRRWTFIEVAQFKASGQYRKDFSNWAFDQCPEGVLNFALEGLDDLLSVDGHYINPASGIAAMIDWQLDGDLVGQFLSEIKEGAVLDGNSVVMEGENRYIGRLSLWKAYCHWHRESFNAESKVGKKLFFETLRKKKIKEKRSAKGRYFLGIGVLEGTIF